MNVNEIKLKDYPELKAAHKFVSEINRAVIAGGVARDILLKGKLSEGSDIDIFIGQYGERSQLLLDIFNVCKDLKIKPSIVESYSQLSGERIRAGNLDIILVGYMEDGVAGILSRFDMVSSQAWLVPIIGGFEVCATDLFFELKKRKVLGYYPELCLMPSGHVDHIVEQFPDYMKLALAAPRIVNDDEIPF